MSGRWLTLHDVVTVGDKTNGDATRQDSELPNRNRSLGCSGIAGVPGRVDDSPGTDRVANIVGTVGERGGTSGDDLDEGVGVLDFVGVLLGVGIDTLHSLTVRGTGDTGLG